MVAQTTPVAGRTLPRRCRPGCGTRSLPELLDVVIAGRYRTRCGTPATGWGMDEAVGTAVHSTDPARCCRPSLRKAAGAAAPGGCGGGGGGGCAAPVAVPGPSPSSG